MKNTPIKELPTFVNRTYRGGKLLKKYLGMENTEDSFYPEDWISSFTEAKNKEYLKNEGITRVETPLGEKLITEVITESSFGKGRFESGVLIKFLDSAERLGIQVHPDKKYAKEIFNSSYGKTECWHILDTREEKEPAAVYLGFKEYVTKEIWAELFNKQDINGMLEAMHKFEVKKGDTILVTGGTPHAIGGGCFLLEIQEPCDYTMRVEKTTLAGESLTPMQVHYGVGEEKMLDCFNYTPRTREETKKLFFLESREDSLNKDVSHLVTYGDTPCFKLDKVCAESITIKESSFITVIVTKNSGKMLFDGGEFILSQGDKFFIPAGCEITLENTEALICYPPEI